MGTHIIYVAYRDELGEDGVTLRLVANSKGNAVLQALVLHPLADRIDYIGADPLEGENR